MSNRTPTVPGRRTWQLLVLSVVIPAAVVCLSGPGPFRWSMAAALGACLILPLRYVRPRLVLLACLPGLAGGLGWPAAMVSLYAIGRATGRRMPTMPWIALCAATSFIAVLLSESLSWQRILVTAVACGVYSLAPAVLGLLITTREQLQSSLRDLEAAREATVAAREEVARAAERDRIGREIHDAVGHHATMIAVGAAALAATSKDEQTRETAERLRVLAKRALAEMRAALGLLGTDSELSSGIAALPELVARARESGMKVELIGAGKLGDDIPLGVERTVYRLIQETLTNAAKHAEGAEVEVRLERWATELRVTVTNGPPPRPKMTITTGRPGGGLAGLAERIGVLGGRLRARPTSKGGFSVQGRLPCPPLPWHVAAPGALRNTGAPTRAARPEGELRDTKVASSRATNDGSVTRAARAH
ncbi:hypothetical protein GCM10023321_81590 [Pseudonocardia eucalypti]|uniref:histidine kinase n=1 Tax=Pseudonocardia eucalypti TaxID=648755 RepID=A0ABP9RDY0_9PSEU|nr:signal transduction histidine kinase [Pseudonocardia eucalypti]